MPPFAWPWASAAVRKKEPSPPAGIHGFCITTNLTTRARRGTMMEADALGRAPS